MLSANSLIGHVLPGAIDIDMEFQGLLLAAGEVRVHSEDQITVERATNWDIYSCEGVVIGPNRDIRLADKGAPGGPSDIDVPVSP